MKPIQKYVDEFPELAHGYYLYQASKNARERTSAYFGTNIRKLVELASRVVTAFGYEEQSQAIDELEEFLR